MPFSSRFPSPPSPGAPAPAAEPGPWSLGAGVGFYGWSSLAGVGAYPGARMPFVAPQAAASASLERRVGDRSWLVVGASGGVGSSREDVPAGSYGYPRADYRQLAIDGGLRRALTPRGAPVEVSLLALAQLGYHWQDATRAESPAPRKSVTDAWSAGANLGLSVDRELSPGLSLRVATPLAVLSWDQWRETTAGTAALTGHQLSLGVTLAPRLELRLAF